MNNSFTLVFLLLLTIATTAQKWTNYKATDGLVDDYVQAIAFDSQGNTWIGTGGGVSKFDATNWTNYTKANSGFPGNGANAIAIDAQGNIWFGTDYGVSKFDGTNWTNFMASDYVSVSCIAFDTQGNLWIGATSGSKGQILKYDGTIWKSYFIDNLGSQITSMAIESSGTIWVGTSFGGLSKFDGTNLTTYTEANSGLANDYVHSIAIDSQGNKWVATGGGVSEFDNTNWTTYTFYGLGAITLDAKGNVWVASTGWVSEFDMSHWTTYNNPGSIAMTFTSLAIDSFGNKWLGTYGDGVFKFEDVSTGIADPKAEGQIGNRVYTYPNPAKNVTVLRFPYTDKYTLIITDMNGKVVKQFLGTSGEKIHLTTNDMRPGVYMVLLKSLTNGNSYRGEIVVAE